MADYKVIGEMNAKTLSEKVTPYLEQGYSLGSFHVENFKLVGIETQMFLQVVYKTSEPPLSAILASIDHRLNWAPNAVLRGTAHPNLMAAKGRVNAASGGTRKVLFKKKYAKTARHFKKKYAKTARHFKKKYAKTARHFRKKY